MDDKAVFGRICRHGYPKGFITLKHGERIAYAVYKLKRMVEPYVNSENVELKCMYDIACILKRHIEPTPLVLQRNSWQEAMSHSLF